MASHELWGAVAPAIAVAAVAAGFAWQMMRRKTVKPKVRPEPMSWKKDPKTGLPIPNDDPANGRRGGTLPRGGRKAPDDARGDRNPGGGDRS